ncbi:AraC family transcriptional regulator [Larkinella sp. VNQ87]|uniref:AraC family transcriptional regulator n=1 Tax=Larkinella sp. VNQ87 TaxID=3400921 RepID=UPI003C065CF9
MAFDSVSPFLLKSKLETPALFKLSRFKEVIKRTKPHQHDGYFELIVLLEGAGFHWVDTQLIPIAPPMAFFLSPGQVHCWQLTAIPKGYVLLFRPDFIDPLHSPDLYPLVQQLEQDREVMLTDTVSVTDLLTAIEKEYQTPTRHSPVVLRGLTQVLLARILEFRTSEAPVRTGREAVFRRFTDLLRKPVNQTMRVFHFAEQLGVSPQHLNAICRRVSGRSASELITHQVILESKRHLLHTDQTITEIADRLCFSDPSHFVKYFKKKTGHTPVAFRKMNGY